MRRRRECISDTTNVALLMIVPSVSAEQAHVHSRTCMLWHQPSWLQAVLQLDQALHRLSQETQLA